jgi:iron complex transport system substrate-binding protein
LSAARLRSATLIAGLLVGCQPVVHGQALVDDAGDTVRLVAPPRRIVSLNPVITELVFALGAGDRLAGRTSECDYPPAALRVPSVGPWLPPNVEAVVARAPDLVILYQSPATAPAIDQLRALHIPTAAFRTDRLSDVSRLARLLGPALTANPTTDLATAYDRSLAVLRSTARSDSARTVVLVAWDNPLIVLGAGSFVSEMVELAGSRNLFDDVSQTSIATSLEAVAARAPRAVIVLGTSVEFATRPEWQAVTAVRQQRVLRLSDPRLERPGPRAPAAIAALRRLLDSAFATTPLLETSR